MKNKKKLQSGFTLPAILIVSTALFVIGLATLQAAISIQRSINNQYYDKIVQEAAEAGSAYAYACLESNNHLQTWTNPLTQKTDCTGTNAYSYTSILPSASNIKATFSVGNLEVSSTNTYLIVATGTISVMNTSGTSTIKSFTSTLKKSVSWQNLVAGKSSSGNYRTCGIISGSAYCWGNDNYGQLGDGTTTNSLVPVKVVRNSAVLGAKLITDIASGSYHNCVLAASEVYCWGLNSSGQLGNNSTTNSSVPVKVSGLPATVTNIATSTNSSCAIASGEVYCWGLNSYGQLGISSTTATKVATKVTQASGILLGKTATGLATAGSNSNNMCAIASGLAYCWGNNTDGQLGDNSTITRTAPVAVDTSSGLSGKTVTAISSDGMANVSTCAVASGLAYCWGDNTNGKIGNNGISGTIYKTPQAATGSLAGKNVTDIVVGIWHACAIADSKAYCWGDNTYGQLGNNKSTGTSGNGYRSMVPAAVSEQAGAFLGQIVSNLGGGANRGCATANSKTYCWGVNLNGQIGDGTLINRFVPTESIFLRPKNNIFIF